MYRCDTRMPWIVEESWAITRLALHDPMRICVDNNSAIANLTKATFIFTNAIKMV